MQTPTPRTLSRIRGMLIFFMIALVVSGATAFPVYSELHWMLTGDKPYQGPGHDWLMQVWQGVRDTQGSYPFLFYGFDWLAFAHLVIALLFIGPYRDPVRNKWAITPLDPAIGSLSINAGIWNWKSC